MNAFVNKLGQLRKDIEEQRGEFTLYALALPEEAIAWDMLVSARWIDENKSEALRYLVKQVQSVLTKQELLSFSGILLFDSDKITDASMTSMNSDKGWEEDNTEFFGRQVQKAYIFASPVADFQLVRSR